MTEHREPGVGGAAGWQQSDEDELGRLFSVAAAVLVPAARSVARLVASEAWRADGAVSAVDWLVMRLGVHRATARQMLLVAERLPELPVSEAMALEGRLSWDQLVEVCRVATADTDARWADAAASLTAGELEVAARAERGLARAEAAARHRRRSLRFVPEAGGRRLVGWLPDADAATVEGVLSGVAAAVPADPVTGLYDPFDQRTADALVEVCATAAAAGGAPEGVAPPAAHVVVHVEASVLASPGPDAAGSVRCGELADGTLLERQVVERLCCGGQAQVALHEGGQPMSYGRTRRTASAAQHRQLRKRDRHCRMPGCSRARWLEAHHHAREWHEGGRTDLEDLVLCCGHHHRWLHRVGAKLKRCSGGGWAVRLADGRLITAGPPGLSPPPEAAA